MRDVPFRRSYWVADGEVLAGAYPGDRDPRKQAEKLAALKRVGIQHVINLTERGERHFGRELRHYEDELRLAGMTASRHPIRDMSIPTKDEMTSILDEIDGEIGAGHPTFVHCLGGRGRTGTVVGCWLLRHGLATPANIIERIAELRSSADDARIPSPDTGRQRNFTGSWVESSDANSPASRSRIVGGD